MSDERYRVYRWAVFENMITLAAIVCIVVFAPGLWKWTCLLPVLNLNYRMPYSGQDRAHKNVWRRDAWCLIPEEREGDGPMLGTLSHDRAVAEARNTYGGYSGRLAKVRVVFEEIPMEESP